ncbi:penicillin-binding protein 1C [uncultured Roseibium sp.]|uniref:penicillin-binding protein 1C n=1 Tax=uncultured Roseibium sp. TaxID=1936171 RepID=UPI00262B1D6D|nr:penicillin-binding protein 1C [uncultured Roseibium sp.]
MPGLLNVRHRQTWRKAGQRFVAASIGVASLAMCGVLKVQADYRALPPLPAVGDLPLSVVVLDRQDRLLRAFTSLDDKWRLPVELENLDPLYIKMLLAFEDQRFHRHNGIDVRALLRSVLASLRKGQIVSGGSTLTMQVARLLDERPTRSLKRKYEQFLKAVQLEQAYSKENILHFYALRAPFGGNLEGVRAASLTWFGKEPKRLTPAQAALLVALPQSPEARRPDRFADNAMKARNRVLRRALEAGVLTRDETVSAMAEPVRARRYDMPFLAPHESREARSGNPARSEHNLTLDRDLQAALEKLARRKVTALPAPISASIIVADHQSGEIVARIGAPDMLNGVRLGHVDMTRAVRSPGSTLKPFIYGLAFEEGIGLPQSLIVDRAIDISGYQPTNFDQAYQGTVTLREALQLSLNTPAVQLLEAVGPARLIARLKRAGVRPVLKRDVAPGLAISLGGVGITLKDLAQAYAALARGGVPIELTTCRTDCKAESSVHGTQRFLSGKASWMVSDILTGLPQTQSAETSHIAYKTGTAYGYRDAWAAGFDGRYVVAVWVGRPDGTPVPGQTGASAAVPILFEVFQKLGPDRVPMRDAPADVARLAQREVPVPLRYARLPDSQHRDSRNQGLRIAFPPDGAELDLGLTRNGVPSLQVQPLVVKLKGGKAPYSVLINGRPLPEKLRRQQLVWQPDGPGFTEVTVLDRSGRSDKVTVLLR